MIFAYMRISTTKETQKHDRQKITIEKYALDNNFAVDNFVAETISGKVNANNRPLYIDLKNRIRRGDVLLLSDLDRLGRDADDTIAELKNLKGLGVRVIALDIPYMNQWAYENDSMYEMITDIVITLKAHMAQQERIKTVERVNQGLEAAKAKGVKLGRPAIELPDSFIREYEKYKNGFYGNMSAVNFAKMLGMARSTLYKYIDLYNKEETAAKMG